MLSLFGVRTQFKMFWCIWRMISTRSNVEKRRNNIDAMRARMQQRHTPWARANGIVSHTEMFEQTGQMHAHNRIFPNAIDKVRTFDARIQRNAPLSVCLSYSVCIIVRMHSSQSVDKTLTCFESL